MVVFAVVLLAVNAALVLAIVVVLKSLGKQSRRIARIAQEAHDLAERAERHVEEVAHGASPAGEHPGKDAPSEKAGGE